MTGSASSQSVIRKLDDLKYLLHGIIQPIDQADAVRFSFMLISGDCGD